MKKARNMFMLAMCCIALAACSQGKANNSKVITIGQKTAGGPCVVKHTATGIGTVYSSSGLNVISLRDGNTFKNIDGGQAADHAISKDKFYDRAYVYAQLKTWLKQQ